MKVQVLMTPAEAEPAAVQGATVVVVDVIRATTTMVEALAHGARAIYPVVSTEDAVKLAASLGREDTLLCGERRTLKVEGFDLGNSPREFTARAVKGKRLVMSTTNGTVALAGAEEGARVLVASFTNLGAVARAVAGDASVAVVCAGRMGRFALDDAFCAGHLVRLLPEDADLNDGAQAVRKLAAARPSVAFLARTEAGRALGAAGLGEDLAICAQVDRHDVVPVMREGALVAPRE